MCPSKIQSNVNALVQRLSSWLKLLKFIALCLQCQRRFITRRQKSTHDGFDGGSHVASLKPLTCSELNDAEREVIMFDQSCAFAEERRAIQKGWLCDEVKHACKIGPALGERSSLCRWTSKQSTSAWWLEAPDNYCWRFSSCLASNPALSPEEWSLWQRIFPVPLESNIPILPCEGYLHQGAVEQKMVDLPRPWVTPDQPPFIWVGIDYFGHLLCSSEEKHG